VKQFLAKVTIPIRRHLYVYLAAFIVVSIAVSSSLILKFEADYPNSQIQTVNDAIWWSTVGISTIGIGNIVPESDAGRYLTLFLMVVGVVIFSVITAKIAAFFTEEEVRKDLDKEINVIEKDLNRVEKNIEGEVAVDDRKIEKQLKVLQKRLAKVEKSGK